MPVYVYPASMKARIQAYDGAEWKNLLLKSPNEQILRVTIADGELNAHLTPADIDGYSDNDTILHTGARLLGFNGSTWDRIRTHMLADLGTFTAPGTGTVVDTVTGFEKWTWTISSDASSSAITVNLEGSIDGENWYTLDTWTGTGSVMRHVVNKPVRYIRASVTSMGDATQITVKIFGMR